MTRSNKQDIYHSTSSRDVSTSKHYPNIQFPDIRPLVALSNLTMPNNIILKLPSNSNGKIFRSFVKLKRYRPPSTNPRTRIFPRSTTCNGKRCCVCSFLVTDSVIQSSVNSRNFNVCLLSDVDCNSKDVIYTIT